MYYNGACEATRAPSGLRVEDRIHLSDGRHEKPTTSRPQEPPRQVEVSAHGLPEAVKNLIEARTGDVVYVVDPDYRIVHWDSRMESLAGVLAQEALGQPCYEAVMGEREDGHLSAPTAAR